MERLAALVPEPWTNLTRYRGVFVPGHGWRDFIVPGRPRRVLSMDTDLRGSAVGDDEGYEADNEDLSVKKKSASGRAPAQYWMPWADLLRRTF